MAAPQYLLAFACGIPSPVLLNLSDFQTKSNFQLLFLKNSYVGPTQTHPAVPWFVTLASLSICIGQRPRQGLRPGLEVQGTSFVSMRKSLKSANGPVGGRVAPPTPVCTPQLGSQHPRCPQPTGRENLAGNSVSGQFWLTRCHQAETRINRPASFLRGEARQGGCQGPQLGPLLPSAWFLPGETHLAWVPGPPGPRSGVPGVCRGRWGRGLLCGSGLDRVFLSLFGVSQTPCCPPSISQRQQTLPGACLQPGADPEAGGYPAHGALGLAGGQPAHRWFPDAVCPVCQGQNH